MAKVISTHCIGNIMEAFEVHTLARPQDAQLVRYGALSAALALVKAKEAAQGRALPQAERRALVLEVAQALVPLKETDQALSFTFSAVHAQKDLEPVAYKELADHVALQANSLETRANSALDKSKSFPEWNEQLSYLAEEYSFILEAAQELAERGTISVRANSVLQSLMEPPASGQGAFDMYTKAMAISASRNESRPAPLRQAM